MVYLVIKVKGTEKKVIYAAQDKTKAENWADFAKENAMSFENDYDSEYYIKEMWLH